MSFPARTSTTGEPLTHLSAHARLPLSDERAAQVGPMFDVISGLIDQLDELPMPETPVATAFDARWE